MRSGPDFSQLPPIEDSSATGLRSGSLETEALTALGEQQRQLIAALQSRQNGMTLRQLQAKLSWSTAAVQRLRDGLLERQLVARLNTIIPSYTYRYGGVDLDTD